MRCSKGLFWNMCTLTVLQSYSPIKKKIHHTESMNIVSLRCVVWYVSAGFLFVEKSFDKLARNMVFLLSGFYCDWSGDQTGKNIFHMWSRWRAYLRSVSSGDFSGFQSERICFHTECRNMVSLLYEFSCELSKYVTGRRISYTYSIIKVSSRNPPQKFELQICKCHQTINVFTALWNQRNANYLVLAKM